MTEGAWPSQLFHVDESSYEATFERIASGATAKHEYSVQAIEGPQYVRSEPALVYYKPEYGSEDVQVWSSPLPTCIAWTVEKASDVSFGDITLQRTKSSVLQLLVLTNTMKYQRALLRVVSSLVPGPNENESNDDGVDAAHDTGTYVQYLLRQGASWPKADRGHTSSFI